MPILTSELIDSLRAGLGGQNFYWDSRLAGFGIKILKGGRKKFIVQYQAQSGDRRRKVLGDYEVLSVCDARHLATEILREVAFGKDPIGEMKAMHDGETIKDLCDEYIQKHALLKKKMSSIKEDQSMIARIILPAIGSKKVAEIKRADLSQLHYDLRDTPIQANRVRQLLSKMFNLAEKWEWRPDNTNPTKHVEPYPDNKRERYLTFDELMRLSAVLNEVERNGTEVKRVVAALRLLIFTGCRHNEIMTLKWEYVDFEHRCLRLPDSKTGPKDVQLGLPAIEVLKSIHRMPDNPYVFYGKKGGQHWTDLQRPWERIRAKAGIPDVRIHDLRHTFASVAVNMGEPMSIIGKLLGHTRIETTERYAHVAVAPQLAAADRISSAIAAMMAPNEIKLLPSPMLLIENSGNFQ